MNSYLESMRHKLQKYGEIRLDADGVFSQPGKYWTITRKEMADAERAGFCRIDTVGESTFAVYLPRPKEQT